MFEPPGGEVSSSEGECGQRTVMVPGRSRGGWDCHCEENYNGTVGWSATVQTFAF